MGIGTDRYVNGIKTLGIPYMDLYGRDWDYTENPNNYLTDELTRLLD